MTGTTAAAMAVIVLGVFGTGAWVCIRGFGTWEAVARARIEADVKTSKHQVP